MGLFDRFKSGTAKSDTTKKKRGKRAYLIFLYSTVPWPANEMARLQRSIQQDEGCPVKTLGAIRVTGPFPTSPDTFVVATGLTACEKIGESWGSTPDIGYRPGGGVGLITVMLD